MREAEWQQQHTIYVTDDTHLTVERWTGASWDSPDCLSLCFHSGWLGWPGTEQERWMSESAHTVYGLSLEELERTAAALSALAAWMREEAECGN